MDFDLLAIGDFRFPGGTSVSLAHEIRALFGAGYAVGLLQKRAPVLKQNHRIHPDIQACLDTGQATLVDTKHASQKINAKLAVLHNPYTFTVAQSDLPHIVAEKSILVTHQPILDHTGLPYFNPSIVQGVAERLVGREVIWAPISPACRSNLIDAALPFPIHDRDWINFLFPEEWTVDRSRPVGGRPVIGRHGRPEWSKWPADREAILTVYPESDEFEVRLLGVSDALRSILDGPIPDNWHTFEFGELTPAEFLRQIDFFVYYHHPDWFEGFGRTIAEAAASGAVCILPKHFEPTFGASALYREPEDVLDTVRGLYSDWDKYLEQSARGRQFVRNNHGPENYLSLIESLIGPASPTKTIYVPPEPVAAERRQFDVIHLGDMRTRKDTAWRIAHEVRIQADVGYSNGLMHVKTADGDSYAAINPVIDELVQAGVATPINPASEDVWVRLLIVDQVEALVDGIIAGTSVLAPRVLAEHVVVVIDTEIDEKAIDRYDGVLKSIFGRTVTWTGTSPDVHATLKKQVNLSIEPNPWRVSLPARGWRDRPRQSRAPVLGRIISVGDGGQSIDGLDTFNDPDVVVRVMGQLADSQGSPVKTPPAQWEIFSLGEINWLNFLRSLTAYAYFPAEAPACIPVNVIARALAEGIPTILPSTLRTLFGAGPIYAAPENVLGIVKRISSDSAESEKSFVHAARQARRMFGPGIHETRLHRLIGPLHRKDTEAHRPPAAARKYASRRVLFMSTNGIGIGHLTRLLAIARRMPKEIEPVFLTLSQAASVVRQAGYPLEFLPFHAYAQCATDHWNKWLVEQLRDIVDFHDAKAVVFDGGMPYAGLVEAIGPRDVALVWIRRAMWRREKQNADEAIRRQRFFDLIVEPGEVAEAMDDGATVSHRSTVRKVPAIRLLDPGELLDRESAAAHLGLDPTRPAVLIQLGSGWNRDLTTSIEAALKTLKKWPDAQPVIAEWLISTNQLDLWPGVKRISGFPLSKYYKAFDFTISAAGYNSFNEIISFGLPAIFVANEDEKLDDQDGRALFAEQNGAAFRVPLHSVDQMPPLIEAMKDEKIRWFLQTNALRLAQENGAAEAAGEIARLVA